MKEIEIELDGTVYQRIGRDWYDASTYISAPTAVARKLDERLRVMRRSSRIAETSMRIVPGQGAGQPAFRHAEAFPIIADVIRTHSAQTIEYVTHQAIKAAFLDHPEGCQLAEAAARKLDKPVEWAVSNIVAWFSKRFTEGATPYQDEFERARIDGRWAYRRRGAES